MQVGLNVPIGVNEMVLAVWLILKGFNPLVLHDVADGKSPNRQSEAGECRVEVVPSPLGDIRYSDVPEGSAGSPSGQGPSTLRRGEHEARG